MPRKEFSGWFLAILAYKDAGLSDVVFNFSRNTLHLLAFWGETSMAYQGKFTGQVRISAQKALMLARKGEKMLPQPLPVTVKLYPHSQKIRVDSIEAPALIQMTTEVQEKNLQVHSATAVGLSIIVDDFLRLIKQASPGKACKKDTVKFIASSSGLTVKTAKAMAEQDACISGSGSWTLSLDVIVKALKSYDPATLLTIEVDSGKMKMNTFHLPVLAWESL